MQVINQVLADELKQILKLQEEILLLETKYTSLLKVKESSEVLKNVDQQIQGLKEKLRTKERQALTLFN